MDVHIQNHSNGDIAGVTLEHQLQVEAEIHELQHHVSRTTGQSYQVLGVTDTLTAGIIPVLHITNNDPDRKMVVSFIRSGVVASAATLPNVADYFSIGFGTTASGGTAVTPTNANRTSGSDALVTALSSTPTSAGTFEEFDRWYPASSGDRISYNKQGSVILGLNDSIEIRHTNTSTGGTSWARVTLMMMDL